MPARQDQTLQIFLIIFIFAFLVTSVVAYLGWRGYSEAEARYATTKASLDEKTTQTGTQQTELEELREIIGFQNANTPSVKEAFTLDMVGSEKGKGMASGILDAQKLGPEKPDYRKVLDAGASYRKVLQSVYEESQQTAFREAKLKQLVSDTDKTLLAVKSEAQKQIDKYDEARKKAQEDLANQTNAFTEYRRALENSQSDLKKSLEDQQKNYEGQITKSTAKIKSLDDQVASIGRANKILLEQRKDEPGSFEVADGRISMVNQNGTVWINLGSADSLRRQVTFSVFDSDQHDAAKATKKGSIEVTRILDEHMAEARITKDAPTNPILTGDNIYSQVWHRGKKLHFAFTGVIDIDGDGQSDLQLARDLIELNGGIVDAYLKDDGKVSGEITANTRYLVLGDVPDSAVKAAMQTGFHEMSKTAASLGVQTITLPEFIDQMGYKPQDRTVHLGTGASGRDFPARPESISGQAPISAGGFRVRPAPAQPATSAKP